MTAAPVRITGVGLARAEDPGATNLTELVFEAAAAALADAGISRADVDGVSIAASDQLDGRAISSMQLAGPAGAYLKDEIKVGDDGALALASAVMRIEAGADDVVLAVSWTKSDESPPDVAVGVNPEPVYARPAGLHPLVAEAALSGAFLARHGLEATAFGDEGDLLCWPIRTAHVPPPGNGAVALVVTAGDGRARGAGDVDVAGLAFGTETADPTARRLTPEDAVAAVAGRAASEAGVALAPDVVLETTDRTPFRLAMTLRGLGHAGGAPVNPSGGLWASNPIFAAGLERVAHAALAVRAGAPLAVAHSSYGYAGQGQFVAVFRPPAGTDAATATTPPASERRV